MLTLIIAIVLIILFFFVIEGRLRRGDRAKSFDAGASDQGSTRRIGQAFAVSAIALLVAVALDAFHVLSLPDTTAVGWIGLGVMLVGIAMRIWAALVLGIFYTRTLITTGDQRIVQEGPYRLIRHPGYLGTILVWIGAALASSNWLTLVLIPVVTLWAYVYRIQSEEVMLAQTFGEPYAGYRRHTWRLLPPIY